MRYNPIPYDHLVIPQGATFEASWPADDAETGGPAEWTGWTARMQIRALTGEVMATLATEGTPDGVIELADEGNITARLPATFTATMASGRAVFDLEFTAPDESVWRVVEGAVTITSEVTNNA